LTPAWPLRGCVQQMQMLPPFGLEDACTREVDQIVATSTMEDQANIESDTLIFVDIDGVLNIAIRDPKGAPLLLSEDNAERALAMWSERGSLQQDQRTAVERIVATCSRQEGPFEDATYSKLLCAPNTALSDLLVGRLARLIEAAGRQCKVVLSSTWRLPRHSKRAHQAEAILSRHLGRHFAFDARTAIWDDNTPELRLECIADFAAEHCEKAPWVKRLRMLVLEDFHTTPFGTWHCRRQEMGSADAVEQYLRSRVPARIDASVRLIHTYDEWTTDGGLSMKIGCGLTRQHCDRALGFLEAFSSSGNGGVFKQPVIDQNIDGKGVADECMDKHRAQLWVNMSDALVHAFRSGAHVLASRCSTPVAPVPCIV